MMMIRRIKQQQQQQLKQSLKSYRFRYSVDPKNKILRTLSSSAATASYDDNNNSASSPETGQNPYFPNLFSPLDLGPAIGSLPNRVIMGSMHTGLEVRRFYSFYVVLDGSDS